GDRVAKLVVSVPGDEPVEVPLVAANDVPRLGLIGRLGTALQAIIWGDSR
ncbi:MAG: D-alanyl-D-alanine carboxypeptidase, partial [Alphaproteobacteria bacterium]|nr:D-alanyl-D-alanine carboxypeptidase [Alphaproteobacteria bacterium]